MRRLAEVLRQTSLVRYIGHLEEQFPTGHLKDLLIDEVGPDRMIRVGDRWVVNFGSDSFLGLDQDPRVHDALLRGIRRWGTHSGASRAFASIRSNAEAEDRLARWLGTEAALIYPSVMLANLGALPGLVGRPDLLVVEDQAHHSIQEGAKIARAGGARQAAFSQEDPHSLEHALQQARPYRCAVVALDGVSSMSGRLPPLAELDAVARRHDAILYVDDAHGTGVLGPRGRGTVPEALGSLDNALVVGSLSKAFSCAGGFIGCTGEFKRLLKIRSSTYVFGGPVPPPYLEAICTVLDILDSEEYQPLRDRLDRNIRRLTEGLARFGLAVLGGLAPIVCILVGGEEETLEAGRLLFERGYYVQSVAFPAVPYHAGVLRIQVNANHSPEAIDGLLAALVGLRELISPRGGPWGAASPDFSP
jgi:7-keto-8-aminopelargonate synthetase-like enzyme